MTAILTTPDAQYITISGVFIYAQGIKRVYCTTKADVWPRTYVFMCTSLLPEGGINNPIVGIFASPWAPFNRGPPSRLWTKHNIYYAATAVVKWSPLSRIHMRVLLNGNGQLIMKANIVFWIQTLAILLAELN